MTDKEKRTLDEVMKNLMGSAYTPVSEEKKPGEKSQPNQPENLDEVMKLLML